MGTVSAGSAISLSIPTTNALAAESSSITVALVITRSSGQAVQPATGGARVGAVFQGSVPVQAVAPTKGETKGLPPQLLKVDEQLGR